MRLLRSQILNSVGYELSLHVIMKILMKTKLENKDFIIEIINNNRWNGGVSLNILTVECKIFDRSITKDVIPKISSLLGLSINQEAIIPLG